MSERIRRWQNGLFNLNHKLMNESREHVDDVKRELMTYNGHEIIEEDNVLIVSYANYNTKHFDSKEFDLDKFYAWVEAEAKENNSIHFWPDGDTNEIVFHYQDYVGDFEEQYVTDYFNLNK